MVRKKLQNKKKVLINEQYEVVELNSYGYHPKNVNVLDDDLKKPVDEEQVKEIYDDIDNLSIEDSNIENPYTFISDIPLQYSTFTLQNKSSLKTDDLLENCDDYIWINAIVISDN